MEITWLGACVCFFLFVILVVVGIIILARSAGRIPRREAPVARRRRPEAPPVPRPLGPGEIRIRETDDGFWLEMPGVATGSEVRYRYRVRGQLRSGMVLYEPGPQGVFVYTGDRPSNVEIVEVIAPGAIIPPERLEEPMIPPEVWPVPPPEPPPPPPSPPRIEPRREYPPAY